MPSIQSGYPPESGAGAARALLELVRALAEELHPGSTPSIDMDSSLDRDAGIDSLGRVELLQRLERRFGITLPEQSVMTAETLRDLLRALGKAEPERAPSARDSTGAGEAARHGPAHNGAAQASTLLEALDRHVQRHAERVHIHLYGDGEQAEPITYGALLAGAQSIAAGLRQRGVVPGQNVALMLPTGREFFHCFYGILTAGAVPVPIYPPYRLAQIEEHLQRQAGILSNAQAVLLITVEEAQPFAQLLKVRVPEMHTVLTASELAIAGGEPGRLVIRAQDSALIQYTSGSTGNPKGVVLSHANLLANVRAMGIAAHAGSEDVFVSWLPLYHDMGLIGACMGSLYHGIPLILMSPLAFIARPQRWLWAIHRHRGTLSAAPNFAYDLCANKIADADIAGLDLSSWRLAFNGAEPVNPDTLERFCTRFGAYGFHREAMTPVYGLAECSVGLAFPPIGRGPRIDHIQRDPLVEYGRALPANPGDAQALRMVACGIPLPDHQIRIVDHTGRETGEREEGRLEFRGPSTTRGYFRNAEATRELFHGEWLDSGDYAYMANGEVFITGRAKDLIIRAGRNLYPYELEQAVGDLPGIRKNAVAVFASRDPDAGTERLVVLAETRERLPEKLDALRQRISALAMDLVHTPPDDIVLAPPRTVLKTSSGKIRRAACRELYERGALQRQRAVWLQFARIAAASLAPVVQRARRVLGAYVFAARAWSAGALIGTPVWLALCLIPGLDARRRLVRRSARLVLWLARIPLRVHGLDRLPQDAACVAVTNHASYLDGLVLVAALPPRFSYIAKRELDLSLFTRVFLRRIGTEFVERFDPQHGVEDTDRVTRAVQRGQSMLFFPEGTFTRAPGLRPFHMGAFVTAARAHVSLAPIAIHGTRSILRDGQWLPRRGEVTITVTLPIHPDGDDWNAAIRLRDAARAALLQYCGEPDLLPTSTTQNYT